MKTILSFAVHTERLDYPPLWPYIRRLLRRLAKERKKITWFCIDPTARPYRALGYSRELWEKRLETIASSNQEIQQHTHLYLDRKGPYDCSLDNLEEKIHCGKAFLNRLGFRVTGFSSGAWFFNRHILSFLIKSKYSFDCSSRTAPPRGQAKHDIAKLRSPRFFRDLLELPTNTSIRRSLNPLLMPTKIGRLRYCLVYLHDYDLLSIKSRMILNLLLKKTSRENILSVGELREVAADEIK